MFELKDYLGRKIRRRNLSIITPNDEYHTLFCILESVNEEMQDALPISRLIVDPEIEKEKSRIIVEVEDITMTDDLIGGLGKEVKALLIPLHQEHAADDMKCIMPKRNISAFVRLYEVEANKTVRELLDNSPQLVGLLKCFSEQYLGYDLSQLRQFWGITAFLCYNPIFRNIDLTEDGKNGGLYFRVNYWKEHKEPLIVDIKGKAKDGNLLKSCQFTTEEGVFLSHFAFDENYPLLDIDVKTKDGMFIDYYRDVAFIHKISVNVTVKGER